MITIKDIEQYEEEDIHIPNCCFETRVCTNMNPDKESEYIRIYLSGFNNGYKRFVNLSLYDPYYIGLDSYSKTLLTQSEKEQIISDINSNWNWIKLVLYTEYNNGNLKDDYIEAGKNKIQLPDNPPDYSLLKTSD